MGMTPFLQFALAVVIIITAAKAGGYLFLKIGLPSVLGELLVGILIGPSVLNLFHWAPFTDEHISETIEVIAELGVLFLMFIAGLELHLSDLAKTGKISAFSGTLGVIFPVVMGFGLARIFGFGNDTAIFTGLVLAATSVSISAQTLMEMQVLRSRVGIGMLGAAVFDDILVVLGLSIFVAINSGEINFFTILWIFLRMVIFMALALAIGYFFLPRLSRKVNQLPISQGLLAFVLVTTIFFAWAAELIGGMAAITGAFLAGLMFARSPLKERIESGVYSLAYSFFVPIFFVNVGLAVNARLLTGESLWLFLALVVVAVISKILGAGLGARLAGFTNLESLQMGAGMTSRGEVGLIVAGVGVSEGLIPAEVFAAIVGVVIVTTLITPAMLRVLFSKRKSPVEAG